MQLNNHLGDARSSSFKPRIVARTGWSDRVEASEKRGGRTSIRDDTLKCIYIFMI